MAEFLKEAQPHAGEEDLAIRSQVSEMLLRIDREGIDDIRAYSRDLDGWDPDSFIVDPIQIETPHRGSTRRSGSTSTSPADKSRPSPEPKSDRWRRSRSKPAPGWFSATDISQWRLPAPTFQGGATR